VAFETGFQIILKATAGGGGKGMRVVWHESGWSVHTILRKQARPRLKTTAFVEKFVEEPRHIEIQVAGDQYISPE
jgi:acetyl-CoA carboxylase biotin carboxylase subunit